MASRTRDDLEHHFSISRDDTRQLGNIVSGGMDTARRRTPATAEELAAREADAADALAYLTRKGLADGDDSIAAILGLVEVPRARVLSGNVAARNTAQSKICPTCERKFTAQAKTQQTCSRKCGNELRARRNAQARLAGELS